MDQQKFEYQLAKIELIIIFLTNQFFFFQKSNIFTSKNQLNISN